MGHKPYGPSQHCMNCGATEFKEVLFLGYLAPVSTMDPQDGGPEKGTRYPTSVMYCPACHLVQLGYIPDPKDLFKPDYTYTSGTTRSIRENFADLYRKVRDRFSLKPQDLIVDIGSNDGTLLSNFRDGGHRVVGIEPTDIGDLAVEHRIPTVKNFLNSSSVTEVNEKFGKARVVTAANVFAHIPNVDDVMKCIGRLLEDDGIFVSESDYLRNIVDDLGYDTIFHEHLRYYSVSSIGNLLNRHGFRVIDVERIPTHGGSIRVYATRSTSLKEESSVSELLSQEKERGLTSDAWIPQFRDRVIASKLALYGVLREAVKKGATIYGIGAPARATTLLNYVGLDRDLVSCVLEVSGSKKIGKFMPGTGIPVFEEAKLFEDQPEYALMLSWHIAEELCPILKRKGYRGDFIIPMPEPRIVRHADVASS